MSIVPAAGFARSSGTGTVPHCTPGGHAVCACATPASAKPQHTNVHAAASALAALRANLRGDRGIPMTPFVVATPARDAQAARVARTAKGRPEAGWLRAHR